MYYFKLNSKFNTNLTVDFTSNQILKIKKNANINKKNI